MEPITIKLWRLSCESPLVDMPGLIQSLALSIQQLGLVNPLTVIPDKTRWFWWFRPGRYIVIGGIQRFKALKHLGQETAPCIIVRGDVQQMKKFLNWTDNETK